MRLFRLTLILWLLLMAVLGGAMLVGRNHSGPGDLEALGITLCDGNPCFLGITPGLASWTTARPILEKHGGQFLGLSSQYAFMVASYSIHHLRVTVDYVKETGIVDVVYVESEAGTSLPVTAGETIRYLGLPCSFGPNDESPPQLGLDYAHIWLLLSLADQRVSPLTPISFIGIQAARAYCQACVPWFGFAKSQRYLRLANLCPPV